MIVMHEHVHLPLLSIKTAATSVTILLDFPQTFLPCLMLSSNNKNYILWSLDAFIVLQPMSQLPRHNAQVIYEELLVF